MSFWCFRLPAKGDLCLGSKRGLAVEARACVALRALPWAKMGNNASGPQRLLLSKEEPQPSHFGACLCKGGSPGPWEEPRICKDQSPGAKSWSLDQPLGLLQFFSASSCLDGGVVNTARLCRTAFSLFCSFGVEISIVKV